jgi:hypothetical protein
LVRFYLHILGLTLLVFGIFGFIHPVSPDGQLFNTYQLGVAPNIILIVTGLLALSASVNQMAARSTAGFLTVLFTAMAVYGFIIGEGDILGFIPTNLASSELYLFIALYTAYFSSIDLLAALPGLRRNRA